jgi:hypothetical protein
MKKRSEQGRDTNVTLKWVLCNKRIDVIELITEPKQKI